MHYFDEPAGNNLVYPCGICTKTVRINHRFIKCILCNYKVHIKCNETDIFFKGINEFNQNQNSNDGDDDDDDDDKLPINCKYIDIDSFKFENNNDFSLFHLNIASLSKHKEELETILTMLNFKFDVIGISETKI